MKKFFILMMAVTVFSCASLGSALTASAQEISEDDCDACFRVTMQEVLEEEQSASAVIYAEKQKLYDINTNPLGYVYDFTVNGENGFAVIVYDEDIENYVATEVYVKGENPYQDNVGLNLYIAATVYWEFVEDSYFDCLTGEELSVEIVDSYRDIAYSNAEITGETSTGRNVTVTYVSKVEDSYSMVSRHPSYDGVPSLSSECTAVAGANILGFYDRYYDELIPNFTPGIALGGLYLYNFPNEAVNDAIIQLYADMGVTSQGATLEQFKNGMDVYCKRVGRKVAFSSCMSGGNFSYSTAISKMKEGQPIALFLSTYNVTRILNDEGKDFLNDYVSNGNHAMVGFGHREITYTYENGQKETYQFVAVASGLGVASTGYFNINYHTTINDCYAVNVY